MGEKGLLKKEPMEELCKENEGESLTLSVVGGPLGSESPKRRHACGAQLFIAVSGHTRDLNRFPC